MAKLLLFDIDGTLFINEGVCWLMENEVALSLGLSPAPRGAYRASWHQPTKRRRAINYPVANQKIFSDRFEEMFCERFKKKQMDALSGATIMTLEILKKRRNKLSVLTSRHFRDMVHLTGKDSQFGALFDGIYHSNNVKYGKPDPRVFDGPLRDFNTEPYEAVYVGDTVADGICAKQAGLGFVAVLAEGVSVRADFEGVAVDFFADKFEDILDYLK